MPPSGTWFGFDPGLAVADERSEDTIEVTGSIRLQVKAGATVLGGFSVDSQSELSQVILDSEITPAYPPAQGEQMGINIGPAVLQPSVMTPFVINGDRVVDLDGKHGVVLSERRTYTAELAHATPPPGESAKLTATGRLNRAQQASRFGSVIAATPPGKDETWHPNFNGTIEMNFSTFWTTAMQSAISDTIAGFVGGSSIFTTTVGASTPKLFFQTVGGELGYISARNPTSMVVTLRSFEDTPTRTSYAIMNNAPYELVAALTPPSATNFRVNPIRLV